MMKTTIEIWIENIQMARIIEGCNEDRKLKKVSYCHKYEYHTHDFSSYDLNNF